MQVSRKESGNSFAIRTEEPGIEVSWQVTGIRKDPYAVQHPIVAEENKAIGDRGHYLQPEAYGQPASMRIGAEREPQLPRQASAEASGKVELAATP